MVQMSNKTILMSETSSALGASGSFFFLEYTHTTPSVMYMLDLWNLDGSFFLIRLQKQ